MVWNDFVDLISAPFIPILIRELSKVSSPSLLRQEKFKYRRLRLPHFGPYRTVIQTLVGQGVQRQHLRTQRLTNGFPLDGVHCSTAESTAMNSAGDVECGDAVKSF